jgi:type IV secretory pathway VirJ component
MKNKWLMVVLGIMLISLKLSAQVVSKDSIGTLKHQKQALQISKDLNQRKIKLEKLENELTAKNQAVDKTALQAQTSADDNGTAAERLTGDAQDKKKARKASNAASDAQRDAKKARKAADSLEGLVKDIESLKTTISDDERKLADIPGYPFAN